MPRPSSPASPSLRYLAASDFELIVGGAGKHDLPQTNGNPLDPSAGFAAGGDSAVAPPVSSGAADGPGFTWPSGGLDTVQGGVQDALPEGSFAVGPPAAGAADGPGFTWPADTQEQLIDGGDAGVDGVPHMCGAIVPDGPPDAGSGDGDGDGQDDGGGDGGGGGHHDDDDSAPLGGQPVAATQHQGDPMSWTSSVPAQLRDHAPALASLDSVAPNLGGPPGNADVGAHQAAPAHGGNDGSNDGSNVLDWAFSPRSPIAGAIDLAPSMWGMFSNLGDRLRR